MILLPVDELKILMLEQPDLCVSIYMPTHRSGPETQQDSIRLRNLLRQAEELLIERSLRTVDARRLLEPAYELIGYSPFWRHLADGLALFIGTGVFRYYPLPLDFEEQLVVAEHFYLKPLLPLLSGDGRFYLLAISQNQVRLLQGSRFSASEVDLEDVPRSLAEAIGSQEKEKQLQFHTGTSGSAGKRSAIFFGHGSGEDDNKQNLLRYFRQIDAGLRELLRDEQAPLLLAGVDYLHPIYHEANRYPHLFNEGITGNPEELNVQALHQRAWAIVEPHFRKEQQTVKSQYEKLAGTERASNTVEAIVPAAFHGRVDHLFVALGVQHWGRFDAQTGYVQLHTAAEPGDIDLLQFAAAHTLLNKGAVYAANRDEIPHGEMLAAIFRY